MVNPHPKSQGALQVDGVAPGTRRESRLRSGFARHVGDPRALVRWAVERAPLRTIVMRWLVLVIGIGALVAVWRRPSSRGNLARHAVVSMSSSCGAAPLYTKAPAEPARLVDGQRDRDYDACTALEPEPWVELELAAPAALERVVVLGRADCCWGRRALPLVLEVADNGSSYREIARRSLPFTRDEPWTIALEREAARKVRLRVDSPQPSAIFLTEIEVYGQPISSASAADPR